MCWVPRMRPAFGQDLEAITRLLDAAFSPSRYESALIRSFHENRKEIREWVIEENEEIVGYICYSPAYHDQEMMGWHLAPVAVRPDMQGRGIGSRLIETSLQMPDLSGQPVFVLGDPGYYPRFGFERVDVPRCPFDEGNQHFLALRWQPDEDFEVSYESDFEEV